MNEFKLEDCSNLVPAFLKLRTAMATRRPADGLYINNGYETIHLEPHEVQELEQYWITSDDPLCKRYTEVIKEIYKPVK